MTASTDALAILAHARPMDLDPPDRDLRERIYDAALATSAIPARRRNARHRRLVIPVVGVATIAAVLVVGVGLHQVRTVTSQPAHVAAALAEGSSARAVLLAAASKAESAQTGTAGRYWHTSTQFFETVGIGSQSQTSVMDDWIARSPNDSSWFTGPVAAARVGQAPPGTIPVSGAQLVEAPPGSDDPYHTRFDVLDRFLTFADLEQLPTDPAALKAYLLAIPPHHPNNPAVPVSDRLFTAALQLAEAPAMPAVRAAAFRLLADLPGLTALGPVRDPLGRSGVGVIDSFPSGSSAELIINPSTGSLLALEGISPMNGHPTITYYEAVVKAGWTETVQPATSAP